VRLGKVGSILGLKAKRDEVRRYEYYWQMIKQRYVRRFGFCSGNSRVPKSWARVGNTVRCRHAAPPSPSQEE
jgi:hypothetical protein